MTINELDPSLQDLILELSSEGAPSFSSLSVEGARQQFAEFVPTSPTVGEVELVRDYRISGEEQPINLRAYRPETGNDLPVLLWIHGGSWILGDLNIYDNLCRALADRTEHIVVSVDYSLAPEHKFPSGLRDCYSALKWIVDNIGVIDGDPTQVSVGGDSAGANLATALCLLARDKDGPHINHQALVYPVTRYPYPGEESLRRGYLLSQQDVHWSWSLYLSDPIDGYNRYASPINASELGDLPPATIITCRFDPLRIDGELYAERLSEENITVNHAHYEHVIHGFITLLAKPRVEKAWDAIEFIGEHLSNTR